jgi:hypothetical protein
MNRGRRGLQKVGASSNVGVENWRSERARLSRCDDVTILHQEVCSHPSRKNTSRQSRKNFGLFHGRNQSAFPRIFRSPKDTSFVSTGQEHGKEPRVFALNRPTFCRSISRLVKLKLPGPRSQLQPCRDLDIKSIITNFVFVWYIPEAWYLVDP